jgi:hypothetical protein
VASRAGLRGARAVFGCASSAMAIICPSAIGGEFGNIYGLFDFHLSARFPFVAISLYFGSN